MLSGQQVKVDFFIVGQPKSGTTALAYFLSQHPAISMAYPKEPEFFARDFWKESDRYHGSQKYFVTRSHEEYLSHFDYLGRPQLLGEASTCYLYSKTAAQDIYDYNPKAKIIILLRNPVDFLQSLHLQYVKENAEDCLDFATALELQEARKQGRNLPTNVRVPSYLYYYDRARYFSQLKRFYDLFPQENLLTMTHEQFKKNNLEVFDQVQFFLDQEIFTGVKFSSINTGSFPRSQLLNRLAHMNWLKKVAYKLLGRNGYTRFHQLLGWLLYKKMKREEVGKDLQLAIWDELRADVIQAGELVGIDLQSLWCPESKG